MKNSYKIISIIAAILAVILALAGFKLFVQEKQAGSEYETLLTTVSESQPETIESTETEAAVTTETVTDSPYVLADGDGSFTTREDIDFEALKERNPDVYAWIEIPETNVDYPVLQHPTDNEYYLKHTIDHQETIAASIYTEDYNNTDFNDHHTVIYGHNMKNGSMFRTLHNFEDADFFAENRDIIIYMPEETRYYKVFAAYTYDNRHLLHSYYCEEPESFQAYLDEVYAIKDFGANIDTDMSVTGEDYVITLSTCVNSGDSTQRYLVQAVLVSIDN